MRRPALLAAVLAAALLAAAPAAAEAPAGWARSVDARRDLGSAQTALALGEPVRSRELVARASAALTPIIPSLPPQARRDVTAAVAAAKAAGAGRPRTRTSECALVDDAPPSRSRGSGRGREGRRRCRCSQLVARSGVSAADPLHARRHRCDARRRRRSPAASITPAAAAQAVRADLLDTYEARFRTTLESANAAAKRGFDVRLAETAALTHGYAGILIASYRSQRGVAASERLDASLARLETAALRGDRAEVERAVAAVESQLEGFRAAPLAPAEQARRAGQLDRFLRLVPIEYDRGVKDGRVTLAFEIQEAISFRTAAAAALADIAPTLLARDAQATRELTAILASLGNTLDAAVGGRAVAPAEQRLGAGGTLARADRRALPRGVEGGGRRG